jgi:hypothetical protein
MIKVGFGQLFSCLYGLYSLSLSIIKNKDMTKYKIIGEKYGVTITKPWNTEMYKHNDTVKEKMIDSIREGITKAYEAGNRDTLNIFARAIQGPTYHKSFTLSKIFEELMQSAEYIQSWLLNQEYAYLVHLELVEPTEMELLGF